MLKKLTSSIIALIIVLSTFSINVFANDYYDWKQYDSRWGNMLLSDNHQSTAMSKIGCRVTAIAIVVAKLGLGGNNFNPATFLEGLKSVGAFVTSDNEVGAMYNWTDPEKVVPGLKMIGDKIPLSGTKEDKADIIRKYTTNGYACTVAVNYAGHYVAADYVSGNTVYMHDPGSSSTNLFNKYSNAGITSIRVFKSTLSNDLISSVDIVTPPTSCSHSSYNSYGKCKNCGAEFIINEQSMSATTFKTTKNDVPVRNRPYSPENITKRLKKGHVVTVVASGKNSVGNLWYKLNDGSWIYSGNLKKVKVVEEAAKPVVQNPDSTLNINVTRYPTSVNEGSAFSIRGSIQSNYNISEVNGYILNSDNVIVQQTIDCPNSTYMEIRPASLNQDLIFNRLTPGSYTLKVYAKDSSGKGVTWSKGFTVNGKQSYVAPTPDPAPTPSAPATSIRFELESIPKGNLPYGKSFSLKGWFRSDSPIVEARAYMLDSNKNIVMQSDPASSTTSNYKIQGYKLDKAMKFNKLSPGGYYLKYYVRDANGDTATWISDMFYIVQ